MKSIHISLTRELAIPNLFKDVSANKKSNLRVRIRSGADSKAQMGLQLDPQGRLISPKKELQWSVLVSDTTHNIETIRCLPRESHPALSMRKLAETETIKVCSCPCRKFILQELQHWTNREADLVHARLNIKTQRPSIWKSTASYGVGSGTSDSLLYLSRRPEVKTRIQNLDGPYPQLPDLRLRVPYLA